MSGYGIERRMCDAFSMDPGDNLPTVLGTPGNVFYFVFDLAAATAWYTARLGVEPVTRASQLVMFDLPGSRLTLHEADSFNQPGPTGTVPYWTVSDVDATVAQWSEHGATPHRGPKTIMTGERLCQLLDPFGNLFGLRQPPG
jgi:predicted enzyme related to lactoylglutathione lyase